MPSSAYTYIWLMESSFRFPTRLVHLVNRMTMNEWDSMMLRGNGKVEGKEGHI